MLIQKYQVVYKVDNSPVTDTLFDKPIDAEFYVNVKHNITIKKTDVMIIPVFTVE